MAGGRRGERRFRASGSSVFGVLLTLYIGYSVAAAVAPLPLPLLAVAVGAVVTGLTGLSIIKCACVRAAAAVGLCVC